VRSIAVNRSSVDSAAEKTSARCVWAERGGVAEWESDGSLTMAIYLSPAPSATLRSNREVGSSIGRLA